MAEESRLVTGEVKDVSPVDVTVMFDGATEPTILRNNSIDSSAHKLEVGDRVAGYESPNAGTPELPKYFSFVKTAAPEPVT